MGMPIYPHHIGHAHIYEAIFEPPKMARYVYMGMPVNAGNTVRDVPGPSYHSP